MPIPDFQTIMLPLLNTLADKKTHTYRDVVDILADKFQLTDEERKQLLPSGTQATFDNRVGWAKTDLKKAGLLASETRGTMQITEAGLNVIAEAKDKIDRKFLMKFEGFKKYASSSGNAHVPSDPQEEEKTPQEMIEDGHKTINEAISKELLDKIMSCSPKFFEKLVVDLIVRMGYGGSRFDAGKAIGKSGDGGVDGIISEDKLGLDNIYIQAKRWKDQVPVKEVRDFAGALLGKKAKKGIFITTSNFPESANEYVRNIEHRIVLIDGTKLAKLMIEHNVGTSTENIYEIKRIDSDYFSEE